MDCESHCYHDSYQVATCFFMCLTKKIRKFMKWNRSKNDYMKHCWKHRSVWILSPPDQCVFSIISIYGNYKYTAMATATEHHQHVSTDCKAWEVSSPFVCKAYEIYFGYKFADSDKTWVPKIWCYTHDAKLGDFKWKQPCISWRF